MIFGSAIGIALGSTGSYTLPTTSSIPGIFFVYSPATSSNVLTTSSVASIEAIITSADQTGSSGELIFRVPSPENNTSKGEPIFKISATGSNNEPRIGIGFSTSEKPIKTFDIKSKIENSRGTELLIRSSRESVGAQVGDEAGIINFVIDSASFNDITTTGSIARIKTKVNDVPSATQGVNGQLTFAISRNINTEVDMVDMAYNHGTYSDFYSIVTSHSIEIKDTNPQTTPTQNASFVLSNGTNPYAIIRTDNPGTSAQGGLIQVNDRFGTGTIFLHGPTGEITGSDIIIDDWGSVSASLASIPIRTTFANAGQTPLTTTTDQYYHYMGSRQYGYSIGIFDMYSSASPTTLTTGAGSYMKAGYVVPEDGIYNVNLAVRAYVSSQTTSDVTAAEYQGQPHDFLVIRSQPSSGNPNMSIITSASVEFNSSDSSFPVTGSINYQPQSLSKGDLLIIGAKGTTNASSTRYMFHSHTLTLNKL